MNKKETIFNNSISEQASKWIKQQYLLMNHQNNFNEINEVNDDNINVQALLDELELENVNANQYQPNRNQHDIPRPTKNHPTKTKRIRQEIYETIIKPGIMKSIDKSMFLKFYLSQFPPKSK